MNEEDRKFLTEWGGDCWMDELDRELAYECGKKHTNRTFDTWEDFGWLWEKIIAKDKDLAVAILIYALVRLKDRYYHALVEWTLLSPADRCQLICDFLREQEGKG